MSLVRNRIAEMARRAAPADSVKLASIESFIAVRLGLTAMVLALTPLLLVLSPAPLAAWQGAAYLALFAPLIAVIALCRSAPLAKAQAISIAGPVVIGVLLAFFAPAYLRFAFCCLFLAMMEAFLAQRLRLAAVIGLIVPVTIATARALSTEGFEGSAMPTFGSLCDIVLVAYGAALGWAHARTFAASSTKERRHAARYDALARAVGDLVLRQDRTGLVLNASQESLPLFDLAPGLLLGRGFFERVHVADRPAYLKAVSDAYANNGTTSVTIRFKRGKFENNDKTSLYPEFAWIDLRMRSIAADNSGSPASDNASVVALVRDVTQAKMIETDLTKAQNNLERATVWKDRFLANISHELRTPLNAIIGFAEILGSKDLSPADPERRLEYAQIIHTSGLHLLEMVNSILDMSKIDAGSFDILPEPFDLPRLLDQCCDMIGLKAEQANIKLERCYNSALEELVADKRACKQIMINLLSNAIKFTPRGGVVKVSVHPEGATFVVSVSDTGIGIAPADLTQIGRPFFQVQNATSRAYEGTGLGLSLVRGLVGLHGGRMAIESAAGCGTTVTIRLPTHCVAQPSNHDSVEIDAIVRIGSMSAQILSNVSNPVKKSA